MKLAVAVDLQDDDLSASRVVAEAADWARSVRGTLDLLYVEPPRVAPRWIRDDAIRELVLRELAEAREHATRGLQALLAAIPTAHRGQVRLLPGPPVEALVEATSDYDALVVVTHGRTGLDHLWSGSVAEQVVRRASSAVIVLSATSTDA